MRLLNNVHAAMKMVCKTAMQALPKMPELKQFKPKMNLPKLEDWLLIMIILTGPD